MRDETTLKPWPFCGEKGKLIEHKFYNLSSTYGVACVNCKCETYQFFEEREEAAKAWNRRVNDENA